MYSLLSQREGEEKKEREGKSKGREGGREGRGGRAEEIEVDGIQGRQH